MAGPGAFLTTVVLATAALAGGCASLMPRDVVPEQLTGSAEPVGLAGVRVWGDAPGAHVAALVALPGPVDAATARTGGGAPPRAQTLNVLAISGGGEDGSFGAGLLVGWSDAGTRPDFDVVTGVSAGALAAPFVFLGAGRNADLRDVFTKYTREDIYDHGLLTPLTGSGLLDSSPLEHLIAHYVDARFLEDVARERRKGRVLLIGTTHLDAQRPVLWDMGRIAMSGHPEALDLFRKVLLASASIPGVFPPVRIKVRAGDKDFEELHVDGGVTRQVFATLPPVGARGLPGSPVRARRLFVIRNGKVGAVWDRVRADVLSISQRAVSTLIKNQSVGDLYRIYALARVEGTDFNLAAIPDTFRVPLTESFEPGYMRALYAEGYRAGLGGYPWMKSPPGLDSGGARQAAAGRN